MFRKGIVVAAFASIAFTGIGCAKSHVDYLKEPFALDQEVIKKKVNDVFTWAQKKDLAKLESAHLYGPKFSKFDDWDPLTRQDAQTAKKGEAESFGAITDFKFTIADQKVDVFGNVAISTFHITYGLKMGADKVDAKARGTMVFVKDGSEWKITHEHFSPFKANP